MSQFSAARRSEAAAKLAQDAAHDRDLLIRQAINSLPMPKADNWEYINDVQIGDWLNRPPYIRHKGRVNITLCRMNKKHRVADELKQQIIRRIKEEGVSVAQAAQEHGVSVKAIYNWLAKGCLYGFVL